AAVRAAALVGTVGVAIATMVGGGAVGRACALRDGAGAGAAATCTGAGAGAGLASGAGAAAGAGAVATAVLRASAFFSDSEWMRIQRNGDSASRLTRSEMIAS